MGTAVHWLATHWKVVTTAAPLLGGAAFGGVKYVESVDERFDSLEASEIQIIQEIRINRCILLNHDRADADPMVCLTEIEIPGHPMP